MTNIDIFIEQLLGNQSLVVDRDRASSTPRRMDAAIEERCEGGGIAPGVQMDRRNADIAKALIGPPLQGTDAFHVLVVALRTDDRLYRSLDWSSRKVLAWRLSTTMEAAFCVDALEDAMEHHGKPDIFNTDQGSPFTSFDFTQKLKAAGIRISMDGKGRWLDNVLVERLWRSLKYECVYLHAWSGSREAREGLGAWITFYHQRRPHAGHGGRTPDAVCHQTDTIPPAEIAA